MPPRGKEGAIRKRTSANAPPLAAHCPSFCATTLGRFLALSACLRACACWRVERVASAALRSATCHNKHTYYCQFGFLRAFSVENHLNLSVGFSSMIKTPSYSQLILLGIKNQEITPLSFRRQDIQKKRCRTCFFSGHLLFINNANSLHLLG